MFCSDTLPMAYVRLSTFSKSLAVLQERIMTLPFGEEGERYTSALCLVLCNRLLSSISALLLLLVCRLHYVCCSCCFCLIAFFVCSAGLCKVAGSEPATSQAGLCADHADCAVQAYRQDLKPVAPAYSYAAISVSNVVATTCQYEALKYVSFPVQTLGKCAKMIPVMIWGSIIMRRSYKAKDYGVTALVTAGTTLFGLTGNLKSRHASSSSSVWGLGLMLGYLGFDGFTSTFQDKLFTGYKMSVYNQMLYTNTFSAAMSLVGDTLCTLFLPMPCSPLTSDGSQGPKLSCSYLPCPSSAYMPSLVATCQLSDRMLT